jgi:hypothetical protein
MSNSESDPEFWTLLQTITIFVLGCWLIDTGLDWSFIVISKEGAVTYAMARILVLLVGVAVILRTRKS